MSQHEVIITPKHVHKRKNIKSHFLNRCAGDCVHDLKHDNGHIGVSPPINNVSNNYCGIEIHPVALDWARLVIRIIASPSIIVMLVFVCLIHYFCEPR